MFQTKVKIKQLLHAWYRNDFLLTFFFLCGFVDPSQAWVVSPCFVESLTSLKCNYITLRLTQIRFHFLYSTYSVQYCEHWGLHISHQPSVKHNHCLIFLFLLLFFKLWRYTDALSRANLHKLRDFLFFLKIKLYIFKSKLSISPLLCILIESAYLLLHNTWYWPWCLA